MNRGKKAAATRAAMASAASAAISPLVSWNNQGGTSTNADIVAAKRSVELLRKRFEAAQRLAKNAYNNNKSNSELSPLVNATSDLEQQLASAERILFALQYSTPAEREIQAKNSAKLTLSNISSTNLFKPNNLQRAENFFSSENSSAEESAVSAAVPRASNAAVEAATSSALNAVKAGQSSLAAHEAAHNAAQEEGASTHSADKLAAAATAVALVSGKSAGQPESAGQPSNKQQGALVNSLVNGPIYGPKTKTNTMLTECADRLGIPENSSEYPGEKFPRFKQRALMAQCDHLNRMSRKFTSVKKKANRYNTKNTTRFSKFSNRKIKGNPVWRGGSSRKCSRRNRTQRRR